MAELSETKAGYSTSRYLRKLEKEQILCTLIFTNGFQVHRALLNAHDGFSLRMRAEGREQIVFLNAVSTLRPMYPVDDGDDCDG